jgi:hypothetical protein
MRNYFAGACLIASTDCAVAWIVTEDYRAFLGGMVFGWAAVIAAMWKGGKND